MATASGHHRETSFSFAGLKVPAWFSYTVCLFVVSRVVLTAIGIIGNSVISHRDLANFPGFLKVWEVWDSDHYLAIAQYWYPKTTDVSQMTNYVFFPLYPLLTKLLAFVTSDYLAAGLVVSSACLFVACYYIYRLAALDTDERTALRSIKYLFLFPTAFILSGVFTESLFLALSVACFYYARKGNWTASGILGALASVTRPYGIVILVPMLFEYLRSIRFDPRKIDRNALALLITPLGMALYMAYEYYMTGDFLVFAHAQALWSFTLQSPATQLLMRFTEMGMDVRFNAILTVVAMLLLVLGYKKIGVSQLAYGLLLILIPLCSAGSAWSMSRYILAVFPLFIICAAYVKDERTDQALTIGLAMLQGLLMATWATWGFYVI